ncbi:hypothetical protein NE688_21190, partial [Eubacterium callanderi]
MKIQKNPSVLNQLSLEYYEEEADSDYIFIFMPHILKPKDPEVVVSLTLFILSLFSNDAFESYKVLPNFISSI